MVGDDWNELIHRTQTNQDSRTDGRSGEAKAQSQFTSTKAMESKCQTAPLARELTLARKRKKKTPQWVGLGFDTTNVTPSRFCNQPSFCAVALQIRSHSCQLVVALSSRSPSHHGRRRRPRRSPGLHPKGQTPHWCTRSQSSGG